VHIPRLLLVVDLPFQPKVVLVGAVPSGRVWGRGFLTRHIPSYSDNGNGGGGGGNI
jgi:hypothetical protein